MNKDLNKSDLILILLGIFLFFFIIAMIAIFCVKGSVPDTLIQCTMGTGGWEAFLLSRIKVKKIMTGQKTGESEDENDGL